MENNIKGTRGFIDDKETTIFEKKELDFMIQSWGFFIKMKDQIYDGLDSEANRIDLANWKRNEDNPEVITLDQSMTCYTLIHMLNVFKMNRKIPKLLKKETDMDRDEVKKLLIKIIGII